MEEFQKNIPQQKDFEQLIIWLTCLHSRHLKLKILDVIIKQKKYQKDPELLEIIFILNV